MFNNPRFLRGMVVALSFIIGAAIVHNYRQYRKLERLHHSDIVIFADPAIAHPCTPQPPPPPAPPALFAEENVPDLQAIQAEIEREKARVHREVEREMRRIRREFREQQ